MSSPDENLMKAYGLLSIAAARKRVYALKARMDGEQELSRLFLAISESETVQARRLFHTLRGKVDMTNDYVRTVFEEEIPQTIEMISQNILKSGQEENTPMIQALSQLREVERFYQDYYVKEDGKVKVENDQRYAVCQFCGYIAAGNDIPESCPVCSASSEGFKESVVNI